MKKPKKKQDNKVEYGTISLPLPLINKVKERIKGTGMNSVSAFVAFVLREVLSGDEDSKIRKKLANLGYLK